MAMRSQGQTPESELRSQLAQHRTGDAVLNWMFNNEVPLNRENYIFHAYAGMPPEPWTMEHENELPEPLQDMSQVGKD